LKIEGHTEGQGVSLKVAQNVLVFRGEPGFMMKFQQAAYALNDKLVDPHSLASMGNSQIPISTPIADGSVRLAWPICRPRIAFGHTHPFVPEATRKTELGNLLHKTLEKFRTPTSYVYDERELDLAQGGTYMPRRREEYQVNGETKIRRIEIADLAQGMFLVASVTYAN